MQKIFIQLFLLLFSTIALSQDLSVTVSFTGVSCNGECSGSVIINAQGGIPPYLYSFNGGAFQSSNLFTNLCPGNYSIQVVDYENNMVSMDAVITEPAPLVLVIVVTSSGDAPSGVIEIITTGGTPPYQYSIDGFTFQSLNIFSDLQEGVYDVTVRDAYGCAFSSPIVINTINIDNTLVLDGNSLSTNIEADTYQWINANTQTPISGETNRTFTANQIGNYRVEMIVTVSDTVDKSSKIKSGQINVSSPTYNVSSILSSSNNSLDDLKLYPNPATSYLKLPILSINKSYIIYNTLGKKIASGKLVNKELSISNLSKGIYFLNVEDYSTTKFIKM